MYSTLDVTWRRALAINNKRIYIAHIIRRSEVNLVVIVGIVVTVKQRQEFRIRLQKRARRAAERKLENYVEEQNAKTVSTDTFHCTLVYCVQ